MKAETENWLSLAEYDLDTARVMLTTGRYIYVVFLCHLALEKALKGYVTERAEGIPPKTHDLILLLRKSGAHLPQEHLEFIGIINNASVPTRYPEDLQRTLREYPLVVVRGYLERAEEVFQWLKQQLTSRA
jgi:HEPN domain-containing protein